MYDFNVGTMIDLNSTIPAAAGWTLSGATGVNSSAWIVGDGHISGLQHAYLLRPATSSGGSGGSTSGNLLLKPGFEEYTPPALGAPGWVSDA